ncbi:MAG: CPBP family intramembrane metalloprotease [Cyclobacteriaceae bacterium]|nr:CPBP family intramembrane metalloprotease [Cyclobacteriaceae bacterium]
MALLAGLYMPGPALATFVIQKYLYKEGFKQYGWTFDIKLIKWILFTPLLFLSLTLLTFATIALLGNSHLVPDFGELSFTQENFDYHLRELAKGKVDLETVEFPHIPPVIGFLAILGQAIIGGSTISLPIMFGEEFGWRGLMLRETRSLGFLGSSGFIGLVWGVWHFPIILMGHNYPHHPYLGILMMTLFTLSISPLFAYVRLKTGSILGACMMHGMLNASGALYALYVANGNELYSSVAGWAGICAGSILTFLIIRLDKKFVAEYGTIK